MSDPIEIMAQAIRSIPVGDRIPTTSAMKAIEALSDAGYAVFPVEPTDAMLTAGQAAWLDDPARRSSTLYRAMIDAGRMKS